MIGSIYFLPSYNTDVNTEDRAAWWYIAGSVCFMELAFANAYKKLVYDEIPSEDDEETAPLKDEEVPEEEPPAPAPAEHPEEPPQEQTPPDETGDMGDEDEQM